MQLPPSLKALWLKTRELKSSGLHNTRVQMAAVAIGVVVVSFFVSLKAMDWLSPRAPLPRAAEVPLPPLPSASRASYVMAPVAISMAAIREAAERATPRNFNGKAENPVSQVLQNADIGWTASRGPISATAAQDALSLSTPLTGKLNVTGSLSSKATGAVGDAIGGLLGANAAKQIGSINIKALNASAEIRGNVIITSHPKLAAAWRVEPNLSAQVVLGDTSIVVAGAKVNVPAEIKPVLDRSVGEQLNAVGQRVRTDQTLERAARAQWARACRSLPLATGSAPELWLELKPVRAIAAQPEVAGSAVSVTIGVEAETRITSTQTQPECPFPDKIIIVPPTPGGVSIAVPIDLPFVALNKIIETQLVGKTFPEDGSGSFEVKVKRATIAPAGERLLISLDVHGKEKTSFFGFGADATLQIWGRPVLDQAQQILRLTDVELAVESEGAFGLLGAAARAVVPHLQRALLQKMTVDLKPFATNAQKKIAEAIAELQKNEDGMRVQADINTLRLADIAYDAKTVRVTAEAQGRISATISRVPGL
jgi:uncharacterized protein DUF4403